MGGIARVAAMELASTVAEVDHEHVHFTTRRTNSYGSPADAAAEAAALRELRSLRRQAYRQRNRCGCCECVLRRTPRFVRLSLRFLCWIFSIIQTLVYWFLIILVSPLLLFARALLHPSFWMGVLGTVLLFICIAQYNCEEQPASLQPEKLEVRVVCASDNAWALEARELTQK